ncbi:MAG TPA: hypothetical protein VGR21_05265, partial [Cryptosporangiaceae bacterium]|nr:hypothetical protein [Cryptosporangiaceae bacterium]
MLVTVLGLGLLAVLLLVPLPRLHARARWVVREPRAALLVWQALGLSAGLAMVGSLFAAGVAPLGRTLPEALGAWVRGLSVQGPAAGLGAGSLVLLAGSAALLGRLLTA